MGKNKAKRIKPNNYYIIAGWMRIDLGLTYPDIDIYAIIYGFSQDGESECECGVSYMMDMIGIKSKTTVYQALERLERDGLIKRRHNFNGNEKTVNSYRVLRTKRPSTENVLPSTNDVPLPSTENVLPSTNDVPLPSTENVHNNEDKTLNNKDIYTSLISEWNAIPNVTKVKRVPAKRKKIIDKILSQYNLEDVYTAFDEVRRSEFLQGDNSYGFVINFDWLMNPDNFIKVLEGNYKVSERKKQTTFNNFQPRSYDMDQLERALLLS